MSNLKIAQFWIIFALLFPLSASADLNVKASDAKSIVKASDDLMRGTTNSGIYSMTVITPKWERKLTLQVYMKNRDKALIRILSPAKEAGIGTLRIDNEMWNYLPKVERTIKIPPSMMMQPWMGSDFANDDLVKESSIIHDYTHTIASQEHLNGHETYKIIFTPKPDAPVIWGQLVRWIRIDDFVPIQEEYYNERGKLIKVLEYSDIAKVSDRIIPTTWTMHSNTKPGHKTIIKLKDVQYNTPINDRIFSRSYLKKFQ